MQVVSVHYSDEGKDKFNINGLGRDESKVHEDVTFASTD